jgi:hypothetical protein
MTTVPIPCPECATVVQVDKSTYDDANKSVRVDCPKGHVFDYQKPTCPECGSAIIPGYWAGMRRAIGRARKIPRSARHDVARALPRSPLWPLRPVVSCRRGGPSRRTR